MTYSFSFIIIIFDKHHAVLFIRFRYFIFHKWYIKYHITNHIPTDATQRSDILINKKTFVAINIFIIHNLLILDSLNLIKKTSKSQISQFVNLVFRKLLIVKTFI